MTYLSSLKSLNRTCLIYENSTIIFESTKRGVQPLIDFLSSNTVCDKNYILVDKIIGRGVVILAKLIGVTEIYTPIISEDALNLAKRYEMKCSYQTLVPYINNRDNTGRCPIEQCVLDITDPQVGYIQIQNTLEALKKAT